jgi:type I restriction enzyme S subunit
VNGRVRLGDVADVFNGKTPSKAEQRDRGHPVLKVRDVDEHGRHRGTTLSFVDHDLAAKYRSKLVKAGDTLILNAAHNADYVASKIYFARDEAAGSLATGEWLLVRPRADGANAAYLNFWLRSGQARDAIRFLVKGIHLYPKDVADLELVLPALSGQRRIVDLLSRAEGIVRLRRQAQQKAASIVPALYLDMFGDPATNSKNLPTEQIDNLCTLVRGSSPRPQGDPRFFGGPVPRLMIADITRDGTYVTPRIDSLTEEGATKSRPMKHGEVVMAVSGAVGLPAILTVDACIHDGFVGFRDLSREITPEFFYNYLVALRHFSRTQAVGATFQNLKTEQIRTWQVPRPSAAAQQRFAELAASARSIEVQQVAALGNAGAIFQALLAQSFPGECQTPDFVADRGEAVPS